MSRQHMTPPDYPPTRRGDVVDDYHGHRIADPYRWLEDTASPDTRAWIAAQNQVTARWLAAAPGRERLRERVRERWDHPRRGAPWRRGPRWFQMRNSGLQDQDVLWVMSAPDDEGLVLVDPNALSPDGTVALTGAAVSRDGGRLAYATSSAGSDWMTWRVRDVTTGEDLDDVLEWSKFAPAAWHPDGSGFYYAWYPPPDEDERYEARNQDQKLRFHRLGTDQRDDAIVYERPDHPDWVFEPQVSHDGRYLILHVWEGTEPENRLFYLDLEAGGEVVELVEQADARYEVVGTDGARWYVLTDRDAPRRRVVSVDVAVPGGRWREVVGESGDTLERARLVGGKLFVVHLHHASHRIAVHDAQSGTRIDTVDVPGPGTVESMTGEEDDDLVHFTFETFTQPRAVLRYDVRDATATTAVRPGIDDGTDRFVTEQVFVISADGTRVPLFLVRRVDVEPVGDVPTVLWGYGGFEISVTPQFKVPWRTWIEAGGLLAVACLRGGGEYGKEWHDAGRLARKQNVIDDFVACAEWLVRSDWTSSAHLGIEGRSNGGLLVAAAMTQRPDLFGDCVPEVGVLDMLRFHRFTIGWAWTSDYGSADDPEQFAWLVDYSPLHNLRPGVCYPPTLLTTGDHDDRVVPGHSFKFAAALQAAQGCDNPALIRIDTSAGHGVGKPVSKLVEERADVLAFHAAVLGLGV